MGWIMLPYSELLSLFMDLIPSQACGYAAMSEINMWYEFLYDHSLPNYFGLFSPSRLVVMLGMSFEQFVLAP